MKLITPVQTVQMALYAHLSNHANDSIYRINGDSDLGETQVGICQEHG